MNFFKLSLIGSVILFLSSCKSTNLVGSWEFVDVYEGIILNNIDTLKLKQNNSKYGTGKLIFNQDNSLISMDSKGSYERKENILMVKYNNSENPAELKISYLDKDYLLLSSKNENPVTWFYRRTKN